MKPKLLTTLATYDRRQFLQDSIAGATVALVALPLSIAIAIASGAQAGAIQVGALVTPHIALNAGVATAFTRGGKTAGRVGMTVGW